MRKPAESLESFNVKPALGAAEAPDPVALSLTGEFELLQPLVWREDRAKFKVVTEYTYVRPSTHRVSWFQRTLALGSSFALIALILLSAILVGIYEPTDESTIGSVDSSGDPSYLAMDRSEDTLTPIEEPLNSDTFPASPTLEDDQLRTARPRISRQRVRLAAYRPLRRIRRPLRVVTKYVPTDFVPTTLVIYAENGEIKTRIEPWLAVAYRKPLT